MSHVVWMKGELLAGRQFVGTFLQLSDPSSCEVMASAGFDFLCVEAEHSPTTLATWNQTARILTRHGVGCLVRTADSSGASIAGALDAGASGVLVPRLESPSQAAAIASAARYPPAGSRGVGPSRATSYGDRINEYVMKARSETLVCAQIESRDGVEALDSILEIDGIDLLFVGPGDLALSHGFEGPTAREETHALTTSILKRVAEAGRLTGVFCQTPRDAGQWLDAGTNLIIVGSELSLLAVEARRLRAEVLAHTTPTKQRGPAAVAPVLGGEYG